MTGNNTVQSAIIAHRHASRKCHEAVAVLTKNFILKCVLIDVEGSSAQLILFDLHPSGPVFILKPRHGC
jgi:hypothetical protein